MRPIGVLNYCVACMHIVRCMQIVIRHKLGAGAHGIVYRGEWRGLQAGAPRCAALRCCYDSCCYGRSALHDCAMRTAA